MFFIEKSKNVDVTLKIIHTHIHTAEMSNFSSSFLKLEKSLSCQNKMSNSS